MSKLVRSLIADVFELAFYQNGKIAITSETLTDGDIEVKVSKNEVKGGRGNGKIATLHSGRDINVKCTDPCFDYNILALNLGQEIVVGKGVAHCMTRKYEVKKTTGDKLGITLEETPLDLKELEIYYKGEKLTTTTDYTITTKAIEFTGSKLKEHDNVTVRPYSYESDEDAERISINASTYAEGGKLVLETLEKDTNEKAIARIQYVFPSAQPAGDFTVSTKSEVKESPTPLEFSINKPDDSDEIGYILRIPIK
ncbi:hypothetical protein FC831_10755 [Clostridium botulinum]|nr:hypothetical protein [Clostridium botulinum]